MPQTETEFRTNNIYQSTTEVSFTPVPRTVLLTETQTVTRVATVPDVRVTTVDRTRLLPPTDYLTVTEVTAHKGNGESHRVTRHV